MNTRPILCTLVIKLLLVNGAVRHNRETPHNSPESNHIEILSYVSTPAGPHEDTCTGDAVCVPFISCPAHFYSTQKLSCKTLVGRNGVCCNTGHNHTDAKAEKGRHHLFNLDKVTLGVLSRHIQSELADLKTQEEKLLSSREKTTLNRGSASYGHFMNSRAFNMVDFSEIMQVTNKALEIAMATRAFKNRQGITNHEIEMGLINQDLRPTPLGSACGIPPSCPAVPERFRRIDGSCNNIMNAAWGRAFSPYSRMLPPSFSDGIWAPRISALGNQQLSSPRLISTTIFSDRDAPNPNFTLMLMQYGQFLTHDISQSIDTSFANGSSISCCTPDGAEMLPAELRHYACMPIEIPSDDTFFGVFKQRCMNFVRSAMSPRQECTLGFVEQMNKITHFIDGSSVYGSTPEQTHELRSHVDGKLNAFNDFGRDLLPLAKDPDSCIAMDGAACFTSGDTRTNQMITLVVLHTIFMREHNRLATELAKINPHWNDDDLFLHARQILIAELQIITYKEFLPAVLGDLAMEEFQLKLKEGLEYSVDYNPQVEPAITNEFASAAFRFGHSMVDGLIKVYGPQKMEEIISIPEVMFHPGRLRKRFYMDEILSTLTTEPIQDVDNSISEALSRYMFRAGNPFGVDLVSINIQRGRDHGLRPYNDYRELAGHPRIKSFDEYGPELGPKLASVYATVDDIDLWVGGLLEEKSPGSIVGPTMRDIIADQFSRLKKGDRYFFENDPSINPGFFTRDQLNELRQVTLSRLICDNSDGYILGKQAKNAFRQPGVPGNEFVDCRGPAIPRINLLAWKHF